MSGGIGVGLPRKHGGPPGKGCAAARARSREVVLLGEVCKSGKRVSAPEMCQLIKNGEEAYGLKRKREGAGHKMMLGAGAASAAAAARFPSFSRPAATYR